MKNLANKIRGGLGMLGLTVLLATALSAHAQNGVTNSFLADGISSLSVSNTLQYTNLASPGVTGTNVIGLSWTNAYGSNIVASGTNYTKLTKDVSLWAERNGLPWPISFVATSTNTVQTLNPSPANIMIRLVGQGAAANSAVTFTFVPLPDGVNESTQSSDWFTFAVTANGATPVCVYTNAPFYKWAGVQKLRVKTVVNGDADASSRVAVTDIKLNGFSP